LIRPYVSSPSRSWSDLPGPWSRKHLYCPLRLRQTQPHTRVDADQAGAMLCHIISVVQDNKRRHLYGTDFSHESISAPRSAPRAHVLPTTSPGSVPSRSKALAFSLSVQCSRQVLVTTIRASVCRNKWYSALMLGGQNRYRVPRLTTLKSELRTPSKSRNTTLQGSLGHGAMGGAPSRTP